MDQQIMQYEKVLELRAGGLSYSRIITDVERLCGVTLAKSCVSYWANKRHSPLGRAFNPVPSSELTYVIGVKFGDASAGVRVKTYLNRIRLQAKDREFVEEFDRCVSKILEVPRLRLWRGAGRPEFTVEIGSYLLNRFLNRSLTDLAPFIEHDVICVAAFLRGFFDSEGSVSNEGRLTVSNTNLLILGYVRDLLARFFGIETTGPHLGAKKGSIISRRGKTYARNSNCYSIYVRVRSLGRFQEAVNFIIRRKRLRLEKSLAKNETH